MSERGPDPTTHLSVDPSSSAPTASSASEPCLQILVLGDFTGRDVGGRGSEGPASAREPMRVEWIDDALAALAPTVTASAGGGPFTVTFESLEDFHPDRLVSRVGPLLAVLTGADESGSAPEEREGDGMTGGSAPRVRPGDPPSGLLDDVVEATEERRGEAIGALGDLDEWVRDVVQPHLEHEPTPSQVARRERREEAAARAVRAVLHHPAVRAIESLWRSMFILGREVDGLESVRVHLLDLSRRELGEALASTDPRETWLGRVLSRPLPGPGGRPHPIGLLVGAYDFGPEPEDVMVLNRLALLAHLLHAPVLAGAAPSLLALESFAEDPLHSGGDPPALWEALRDTPAAASLALFAPRFLARESYGSDGEPCERLDFEEVPEGAESAYLWGNGAFLGAALMAAHHDRAGPGADMEAPSVFTSMPLHVRADGEVAAHPVEGLWDLDAVAHVDGFGVNVLIGARGDDSIRLRGVSCAARSRAAPVRWWAP